MNYYSKLKSLGKGYKKKEKVYNRYMKVSIFCAEKKEGAYEEALAFVLKREKFCVTLTQLIKKKDPDIFIIQSEKNSERKIQGVFHYRKGGTVFCCLEKGFKKFAATFEKFFTERNVFCISARKDWCDFLIKCIQKTSIASIKEARTYTLMQTCKNYEKVNPDFDGNIIVKDCNLSDADLLMPLQVAYIKEEVIPAGMEIYLPGQRKNLENALKNQRVIVACKDGKYIAKAQSNAIGQNFVQLGGVFTLPEFRKKGLAKLLVSNLVKAFLEEKKKTVLFVKNDNEAAKALYLSLNFTPLCSYKICYFL